MRYGASPATRLYATEESSGTAAAPAAAAIGESVWNDCPRILRGSREQNEALRMSLKLSYETSIVSYMMGDAEASGVELVSGSSYAHLYAEMTTRCSGARRSGRGVSHGRCREDEA